MRHGAGAPRCSGRGGGLLSPRTRSGRLGPLVGFDLSELCALGRCRVRLCSSVAGGGFFCAVLLCGFVPLLVQCVLSAGDGRLAGSVDLCSSVLLSVLVLVPVVGLAGFCAGVVCVWQLCSGIEDALFGHAP